MIFIIIILIVFLIFSPSLFYLIFEYEYYVNFIKFMYKFNKYKGVFICKEQAFGTNAIDSTYFRYVVMENNYVFVVTRGHLNHITASVIYDSKHIKIIYNHNNEGGEYKWCLIKKFLENRLENKLNKLKATLKVIEKENLYNEVINYYISKSRKEKLNKILK